MIAKTVGLPIIALILLAASCAPSAPTSATGASPAQPTLSPTRSGVTSLPPPTPIKPATPIAFSLVDDAGKKVNIPRVPNRIVSLGPSNTEILYALGVGDKVVAVTDFDDYPPEAKTKPKVGGMKPSIERIVAQQPDLVMTIGINADLVAKLDELKIPVLVLSPPGLDGVFKNIEMVGKVTGRESQAISLVASMRVRAAAIAAKTKDVPRPRVFYEIDASDPAKPFTPGPGSFLDELIREAGGLNIASDAKLPWAQLSLEEIVKKDPELVILGDLVYGVKADDVKKRPGWSAITAIKKDAVYGIDDTLVSRPGPRIIDGLEALARIIHPGLFR